MTKILIDEATVKLAASILKSSQEYKRGHTIFVEAVEEIEAALAEQPAPVQQGWTSDCLVSEKAKQSGFDLSPMPNMLYTVRGNHAQLVNFARAMLAAAPQPAQQDIDWKDQYEKQKRRAEMWIAKYEADIGLLEKAGPVALDIKCDDCGGSGYDSKNHKYSCVSCGGSGFVEKLFYTSSPPQRKPPEWYVQWIRNNYQDYPNIATLCDAMTKAAHNIKENT